MTTTSAPVALDHEHEHSVGRARFVLLGGVPGAGKTTLLNRLTREHGALRVVDPERVRDRIASRVPAGLPYRSYRGIVHSISAVHTLLLLLRGPGREGAPLVVHDPATRPRRRWLTGQLARRCGWQPALVVLDVPRRAALAGQHSRGRVVAGQSFARHWRRWQEQRPALVHAARHGLGDGPWQQVHVLDRATAPRVLSGLLG